MNLTKAVSIENLVKKYGSPLFIVSGEVLKNNIQEFKKIFSLKYSNVEVAYAYKANYLSEVLNIIHESGAWAEVASGFEYEIAKRAGLAGSSIVYNGPGKTKDNLIKAINEGALINADNNDEIKQLTEIAGERNKSIDIGIRINVDVGINQIVDRFGFNLENGDAFEAIKLCKDSGLLNPVCLHLHLTSYIVEPNSNDEYIPAQNIRLIWPKSADMYEIASRKICELAKEINSKLGVEIKYLDLGGGFPSIDNLNLYAEKTVKPLLSSFKDKFPTLILEPGRAIVKNAVSLLTTVLSTKTLQNGKRAVTADAGINVLPTSFWSMQDVRPVKSNGSDLKDTIIYGPLCLQTDILTNKPMPEFKPGDRLIIENIGAYNIPQSSSFIYPRPQIVMIENNSVRLIRREETIEDISQLEEFNPS